MTSAPERLGLDEFRCLTERALSYPAKRMRVEDRLQIDAVEYLRVVLDPKRYKVAAIRNEGKRSKAEGALAKRMGLLPGMPDLEIMGPGGMTWRIEMKTATGPVSEEQSDLHAWFAANGVPYAVCRSLGDVAAALVAWNIETREAAR